MAEPIKEPDELYSMYNTQQNGGIVINQNNDDSDDPQNDLDDPDNLDDPENDNPDNPENGTLGDEITDEEVEKLLKLPDDVLKEKFGVDDPKQWKAYQKKLTEANNKLKEYEQKSQANPAIDKITELEKQIAELKNPQPKAEPIKPPVMPKMPIRPAGFNYADLNDSDSASYKYQAARDQYELDKIQYDLDKDAYYEKKQDQLRQELETERQKQAQTQEQQRMRNEAVQRMINKGSTLAEANAAYDWALTKPQEAFAVENVLYNYRHKMGIKSKTGNNNKKPNKFDARQSKKKFGTPPGAGGGNNFQASKPGEFSKSTDTTDMYQIKAKQ